MTASAPPGSLRDVALKGVGWSLLQKVGVRMSGLLTFVLLSRLLTPRDFGLVAIASVVVGIVTVLTDAGFSSYLVQAQDRDPRAASTAFWTSLALGSILTLLTFAAAPILEALLDAPGLAPVLRVLSVSFVLVALAGTQTALLRRDLMFRGLARRALVATATASVVAVVLAIMGAGVWSLVAQTLVQAVVGLIVIWSASPWRPTCTWSRTDARRLLTFGVNVVGVQLVGQLRSRGDELIIGAVLGVPALGVYAVAKKLLLVVTDLTTSVVSTVATPVLARVKAEPERLRSVFTRVVVASSIVVTPVMLALAALSPTTVPLVFGDQWTAAGDVAAVLALGGPLVAAAYFDRALYYAVDRSGTDFRLTATSTASHLLVVLVAAPLGLLAVAGAQVVRLLVFLPLRLWVLHRATEVPTVRLAAELLRAWGSGLVAALAAWLVLVRMPDEPVLGVLSASVVFLFVYVSAARLLAPRGVHELRRVLPERVRRTPAVRVVLGTGR